MKGQTLQEWAGASEIFALVFTDIVDSTKLANELKDWNYVRVLKQHFDQARTLLVGVDHHEIKVIGDSFMVVFRSASEALRFALKLKVEPGHSRIEIRAGIHVGRATIMDENDMYGIMVNRTKRIEGTENPDEIRLSDFAKTEIENSGQHPGLTFIEKMVTFKESSEPERVWTVWEPRWRLLRAMIRSNPSLKSTE